VKEDGYVDYDTLEKNAALFRPKLLIAGASAYAREWDYARMRTIADKNGAYFMCDMAHFSGLVAAQVLDSPFKYCDIVTTTTHKTLRGPRSGLIFYRKGKRSVAGKEVGDYDLEEPINFAVFPSCQGGPHVNVIAGVAVALKEVNTPAFQEYAVQVQKNARKLAAELLQRGYTLVTGGTDNHLILWDLRPQNLTGNKMERLFELASISVNKNTVPGNVSALSPGGIRVGVPALTTRNFKEAEMVKIAEFLHRGILIAVALQEKVGKLMKDFEVALEGSAELKALKQEVETFAKQYPLPGHFASSH